ncbi:ATP-binding protein [Enterobacter hormaechei]
MATRCVYSRVISNLLSNAIKFTVPAVYFACSRDGDYLSIRVRDTGVGIPAKEVCACLIPSSRSERAYSVFSQGTGLGLAICEKLISMMDGDISVDSNREWQPVYRAYSVVRRSVPAEKAWKG